ncbi:beta-lactamase/transpeptidase-like protein [Fusarium solani]|uniref:Beta-lactamase/transpeptidase-like protein n=1 Tax=Fusarium solani TaxID=169388 RepID=A0A9P9G1R2_FUSSL|nr:beta-lactamase/transpeptidase-like protein [Fusarium solani]KAH7230871.1 beta-lactamase/transpeptidase-like protein [Fusarium solani]
MLRKTLIAATLPGLALASFDCRPPGPIVPRPTDIASHPAFALASSELNKVLQLATSREIEAGWPVDDTSFSVGIISWDQPDKAVPVWEYHYLAPNTVNGTKEVTRDSQYLIGSVSKVISDYILLRSGLSLDDPITKYIPVLKNNSSVIDWDTITLRHLASGLAGIPQYYGGFEFYFLKEYYESLGFPQLEDDDYEPCGVIGLNEPCSEQQLFGALLDIYPVAKPASRPFYSTISFHIFIHAIQEATGKNYTQLVKELVTERLAMSSTLESPGSDARAVIPPVENFWGKTYSYYSAGAGLVSTLSDLSVFFHSILDRSILDTETDVLAWLKPSSSTGSPYALVGMPWEIYRTQTLTPRHPHTIDLYAKGGAAQGYRSQVAVIDEYGVAIVLLTAGPPKAANFIYNAVLETLVPAIDEAARDQGLAYTGTFVDNRSKSDAAITVTISQDVNSTILAGLEYNGTDMMASYREIFYRNIGKTLDMLPTVARIYPLDIITNSTTKQGNGYEKKVLREEWRIDWDLVTNTATELPGAGVSMNECLYWVAGDWTYYGNESLDRLVFVRDALTREVLGVDIPILRSGFLAKAKLL